MDRDSHVTLAAQVRAQLDDIAAIVLEDARAARPLLQRDVEEFLSTLDPGSG
ncbi:MAG: hypothetical protein OXC31_11775 [Spirochaetaceae bacterium]|nr:hypothetical protein [Spirochaetaceae bacterium]